jgi:DNA-binding protein HU-beta
MADKSLNKTELVAKIAASTGQSQATVDAVLGGLFDTLAESVGSGTKVSIPGWLAVERTSRAARTGRNPQTGATIEIPAGHSVKISAGSKLKAAAK